MQKHICSAVGLVVGIVELSPLLSKTTNVGLFQWMSDIISSKPTLYRAVLYIW